MSRIPKFKNPWQSEAQIASAVREALEANGWEVHPETNGWDLFAVARQVAPRWDDHPRPGGTAGEHAA